MVRQAILYRVLIAECNRKQIEQLNQNGVNMRINSQAKSRQEPLFIRNVSSGVCTPTSIRLWQVFYKHFG